MRHSIRIESFSSPQSMPILPLILIEEGFGQKFLYPNDTRDKQRRDRILKRDTLTRLRDKSEPMQSQVSWAVRLSALQETLLRVAVLPSDLP
ncbi:hypothetical protein CEXT_651381 [Caerostris extrusa]|uniref:Uncharacterized protein n=1 Tax=Caerostris extrusa TaxID=172846 RepID=A0AAV4T5Q1_CAEEX|nr:hypothetical protein CEXT_651381 [Caerostris extrusa]